MNKQDNLEAIKQSEGTESLSDLPVGTEQAEVTKGGTVVTPTGGKFTLTFNGQTT
jgi:hypothetical protein